MLGKPGTGRTDHRPEDETDGGEDFQLDLKNVVICEKIRHHLEIQFLCLLVSLIRSRIPCRWKPAPCLSLCVSGTQDGVWPTLGVQETFV